MLQGFLAEARDAAVFESGEPLFDLATSRFSISDDHGHCLLHLWSEERNIVRRVLDAAIEHDVLQLSVQRFGQAKPAKLEICRDRDRRTPSERKRARNTYQALLRRVLERNFPGWTVDRLSSAADLERSFGPIYTRGLVRRNDSAFAVLGVGAGETQVSIDAALTFAILWLDECRRRFRGLVEGVKLFLPAGTTAVTRARLVHLEGAGARFQLYELDERDLALDEVSVTDLGNIASRLVRCPGRELALRRFAASIERVRAVVHECDIAVLSSSEIAFRLAGLEFARARLAPEAGSFRNTEEIVFGVGGCETLLTPENLADFGNFVNLIAETRRPGGPRANPIFRMRAERWLESLVLRDVTVVDTQLDRDFVYSQVPAFSASDRAMIDVLTLTRDRRLAVIELKADEDIHLPLQGLDYWSRVVWHQQRGEFQQCGYFAGQDLSPAPPLLFLVAPALHVHPATDTLLRYISPRLEWTLLGIHENWRQQLRVIFRKRPPLRAAAAPDTKRPGRERPA